MLLVMLKLQLLSDCKSSNITETLPVMNGFERNSNG